MPLFAYIYDRSQVTQCCRRAVTMLLRRVLSTKALNLHHEIPSAKGLPFFGTTLSLILEGSTPKLHKYVNKRHKQLGHIFREQLGPVNAVFVSDPDQIRTVFSYEGKFPMHVLPDAWVAYNQLYGCPRGLFFMDGPTWWYHRRIMNRILLKGDLKWIEDSCEAVSEKLVDNIHSASARTRHFQNLEDTLYKWSLDIMVSILLGAKTYTKLSGEIEANIDDLAKVVHLVFKTTAKLALIPASVASRLKIPRWNRFVDSVDRALESANVLVEKLIQNLTPESDGLLPKLLNEEIDHENIKRIIVDLVLAAGDTTAYAMEWLLYLTGKHQQIQEQLREEPEFVKNVLKETLRLYPVAPFLTRILPEDATLCGYSIPKGTLIVLSIYTSGRDERYFKNPDSFEPRRWLKNGPDYNTGMQKATLPFAMGLRACIGRKIAETQLHTGLLKIVNNFQVDLLNENEVDMVLKMVAVPSEPIKLRFKKL